MTRISAGTAGVHCPVIALHADRVSLGIGRPANAGPVGELAISSGRVIR